jgi:hypothetical protein
MSCLLMQELHRIAKPNGKLVIRCPHGASDDAWEDPTHVRAFFARSFGPNWLLIEATFFLISS